MKGTWQTTDDGGGSGLALVVIAVAVIAAAAAGPVIHAAAILLRVVLIAVLSLCGLAVAGGIGFLAWRGHRRRAYRTLPMSLPPTASQRVVETPTASRCVLPPQIHLHIHGPVSAEDIGALIARQGQLHELPAIEENPQ